MSALAVAVWMAGFVLAMSLSEVALAIKGKELRTDVAWLSLLVWVGVAVVIVMIA